MAFRTNKTPILQEKSASGSVATFNTALAMPLASCNVAVNAWQEGSGDPSPSNVRNIVGVSEVNIYQRGINLWDEETLNGYYRGSDGAFVSSTGQLCSKNFIKVVPNTTYYYKHINTTGECIFYDIDGNFIQKITDKGNRTFTTPSNCYNMHIDLGTSYGNIYNHDISINYPSTDTDYHAYTGNTYTIQLGQEVYGGVLDVVSGVLTVTFSIIDLGNLSWSVSGSNFVSPYFALTDTNIIAPATNNDTLNGMCEVLNLTSYNSLSDKCIALSSGKTLFARNSDYTDANDFKDSVTGYYLKYPLATPITVQLTPTQIETLIGNNTIFADTGDVDLTYNDLDIAKRGSFREVFKLPS